MTAETKTSTEPQMVIANLTPEEQEELRVQFEQPVPGTLRPVRLPGVGRIHGAIADIMSEVGGVGKTRKNEQQGYKFRGIADIKLACQPILAKYGVHLTPHAVLHEETAERTTKSGSVMMHIRQRIEFRFYHEDGSYFPCVTTGEAMDSGDKASNKCMSAAMKYALDQVFCLPEEDPDADTENKSPELGPKKTAEKPAAPKVAEPKPPADPLTDMDIIQIGDLAKAAGFKLRSDLLPLLKDFGGGATALKLMDRAHLPELIAELKRLAGTTKDVDDVFGQGAADEYTR